MSKTANIIAGVVTAAVLTVPFIYEKDEKGGLKARAVTYDLKVSVNEDGKKDVKLDFGGLIKEQVKTVIKLVDELSDKRKIKKKENDIDSDFDFDLAFTDEDEENFDIELTTV